LLALLYCWLWKKGWLLLTPSTGNIERVGSKKNMLVLEELVEIIGESAIARIKQLFPGGVIKIPGHGNRSNANKLDIQPNDFPQELDDFVQAVGMDAAFILADKFRGEHLYIPAKMVPEHKIVEAIGLELALKLSKELAGNKYLMRQCKSVRMKMRDREILADVERGDSISSIARKHNLCVDAIYQAIDRYKIKG
jgi:hypothetical protein